MCSCALIDANDKIMPPRRIATARSFSRAAEKLLRGIVFHRVQKKKMLQKDPVHREPLERRRAPEEPRERRGLPKAEVAESQRRRVTTTRDHVVSPGEFRAAVRPPDRGRCHNGRARRGNLGELAKMASGALIVLPPQDGSREYPVRRCLRMLSPPSTARLRR